MSQVQVASDYYSNHNRTERFPWSLYHQPILNHLLNTVVKVCAKKPNPQILVIGPGAFQELALLPANCQLTCVDIDARVVKDIQKIQDPRIKKAIHVTKTADLLTLGPFDLIYAKEVIEHITDTDDYLQALKAALVDGGALWLSTPNYGFFLLPFLEATVLELIAKRDGFSRRDIHPTKYNRDRLQQVLLKHGFKQPQVVELAMKMALAAVATK